jgi:N-acetylglucosamine-6-sulfatase
MKKPIAFVFLMSSLIGIAASVPPSTAVAAPARPGIVIIMSDDQRWDTVTPQFMPNLTSKLIPGVNAVYFSNAFVPDPLCCPSRVSTLTGEYSHTTGVFANHGGMGGFQGFATDGDTIATTLHASGYRTGLIGKYLNGYEPKTQWRYIPPGWDRWNATRTGAYYDYWMTKGTSAPRHYLDQPADYSGRVMDERAVTFINGGNQNKPFFLYLAPSNPHRPVIADPLDVGRFSALTPDLPPSIGEPDVSDKPAYIRNRTWNDTIRATDANWRLAQYDAIYSLDRIVGDVWDASPDGTIFLFMSDNGFLLGEHRWSGKGVPYNESIRVPMALAIKGGPAPLLDTSRLVANVDVRETLEGYAGVTDDTSGQNWNVDPPRSRLVLEHIGGDRLPTYCGVRFVDWMYARYRTGEEELYDEINDPYELVNVATTDPTQLQLMRNRAQAACTGGTIYPPDWPY